MSSHYLVKCRLFLSALGYIAFSKIDGFENSQWLRCASTEFQASRIMGTVTSDDLLR